MFVGYVSLCFSLPFANSWTLQRIASSLADCLGELCFKTFEAVLRSV